MPYSVPIPDDVIAAIIAEVAKAKDRKTLVTCLNVSRSFQVPSRKWTFHTIKLDNTIQCQKFCTLLMASDSDFPTYIRSLQINGSYDSTHTTLDWVCFEETLFTVLQNLPHLISIHLHNINWSDLPFDKQLAISSLLLLPHLTEVTVLHMQNLPISIFSHASQLRTLHVTYTELIQSSANEPGDTLPTTFIKPHIHYLAIEASYWDIEFSVLASALDFSQLHRLEFLLMSHTNPVGRDIIRSSAGSLESIVLTLHCTYPPSDAIEMEFLPNLHSLHIIQLWEDLTYNSTWLAHLLEDTPESTSCRLEELTLDYYGAVYHGDMEDLLASELWDKLDSILTGSHYPRLQKVHIPLDSLLENESSKKEHFHNLWLLKFPLLRTRGLLLTVPIEDI